MTDCRRCRGTARVEPIVIIVGRHLGTQLRSQERKGDYIVSRFLTRFEQVRNEIVPICYKCAVNRIRFQALLLLTIVAAWIVCFYMLRESWEIIEAHSAMFVICCVLLPLTVLAWAPVRALNRGVLGARSYHAKKCVISAIRASGVALSRFNDATRKGELKVFTEEEWQNQSSG